MTPEDFMHAAIAEALKAKGQTGENPIVGAVIVQNGTIVAKGYHRFFGGPHAEVEAIKAWNQESGVRSPEKAALYVTLEPCCTVGKTGKCTDAILASGIKKVVVGAIDPNPNHRGKGIEILRKAGIEVVTEILSKECESLNPEFNARMQVSVFPSSSPVLFDTHCHVYYPDFDNDRDTMLQRAREAGVQKMVCVGVNREISRQCLEFAEKYDFIYASAGVHPTESHLASEADLAEIESLLAHPKMVAIGEVGLDFYHKEAPQEDQERIFKYFLEMQKRIRKPLIIHARDCFERLLEILKDFGGAPYSGVFHCFTGDRLVMRECLKLGFHISFSGILTYKKNDELRAAAAECPANRILIETDCPYLPPQSMRGKRNEPAMIVETARTAAQARGEVFEVFARQSTENALKLFGLKP